MVKVKSIFGHFYNGVTREIGDVYEINEADFAIMKQYSVFKEVTNSEKVTEKEVVILEPLPEKKPIQPTIEFLKEGEVSKKESKTKELK